MANPLNPEPKIFLEPTAALVIDLGKGLFAADPLTASYMERLDLSSARDLIEAYQRAGIYEIAQELMCNRKYIVRHALAEFAAASHQPVQIVILAAGKSPLALELLERQPDFINCIYEVDITPFTEKKALYERLAPQWIEKIRFIEHDISSPQLPERLQEAGFKPEVRTGVAMEGITHYLTRETVEKILKRFASDSQRNVALVEFAPPHDTLAPRVRPIAEIAYRIIEENVYHQPMTKFSIETLRELFHKAGGRLITHYPMHEIEKLRIGKNIHFPEANSGWIECVWGVL